VLVVVENIDLRRLLAASITNDGHPVAVASTLAEAQEVLRVSSAPLVAVFNYHLPDGAGLEALPAIAMGGNEMRRHRYVILTKQPPDAAARETADRFGVDIFVVPCVLGDLMWAIVRKARELDALAGVEAAQPI
jgi:DNA-binding NarL/FixJ family response regulator